MILQGAQIAKHIIQTIAIISTLLMTATFMARSTFHYIIMFMKSYSYFNFQGKQNIFHPTPLLPIYICDIYSQFQNNRLSIIS